MCTRSLDAGSDKVNPPRRGRKGHRAARRPDSAIIGPLRAVFSQKRSQNPPGSSCFANADRISSQNFARFVLSASIRFIAANGWRSAACVGRSEHRSVVGSRASGSFRRARLEKNRRATCEACGHCREIRCRRQRSGPRGAGSREKSSSWWRRESRRGGGQRARRLHRGRGADHSSAQSSAQAVPFMRYHPGSGQRGTKNCRYLLVRLGMVFWS